MSTKAIITITSSDRTTPPVRLLQCYDGFLGGCARDLWELLIPSGIVFTTPQAAAEVLHATSIDDEHPWGANRVFVDAALPERQFQYDFTYRVLLRDADIPQITFSERHREYKIGRITARVINRDIVRMNEVLAQYPTMYGRTVDLVPLLPVGLPGDDQ